MKRKQAFVAVGAVVAAVSALAAPVRSAGSQQSYKVTATLKTAAASGSLSAHLKVEGAKGTLAWTLRLSPKVPARSAQIRTGSSAKGKLLVSLCAPCKAAASGHKTVSGNDLKTLLSKKASFVVRTKAGKTVTAPLKNWPPKQTGTTTSSLVIKPTPALVAQGKKLVANFSCAGCHTTTGGKAAGPTWKGLYGSKVHLKTGSTVVADASYLLGVITDDSTLNVAGYDPGIMQEVIPPGGITAAQAKAIIAYIETLK